ncbi:Uncharacterised protein [Providencia rustigianii]|nr:Uncharacterised protein [Providencia rustigianii]
MLKGDRPIEFKKNNKIQLSILYFIDTCLVTIMNLKSKV